MSKVLTNKTKSLSKNALDFFKRHPDIEEWKQKYPETMQLALCTNEISLGAVASLEEDECPSLGLLNMVYGEKAILWVCRHLSVLNVLNDTKKSLSDMQMAILADDIIRRCYYLNLAELCVFLGRIRMGIYKEQFYGSIDAQVVMRAMTHYLNDRVSEIAAYENALKIENMEKEREKWKKNAVTYDEYKTLLERAKNGDEKAAADIHYDPSREYGGLESPIGKMLLGNQNDENY